MENNNPHSHTTRLPRKKVLVAAFSGLQRKLSIELSVHFSVIQVSTAEEGILALQQHDDIHTVVATYSLGAGQSGLELLSAVRALKPDLPRVLIYDPSSDPTTTHETIHLVANVVLITPWEPGQALRALSTGTKSKNTRTPVSHTVERRLTERMPAQHITVQVLQPGGIFCNAKAVDVSRGGILVDVEELEPDIGDTIHILVSLPNWRPTKLRCKVRRIAMSKTQRGCLVGAEFLGLEGWGLTTLNLVLASARPAQNHYAQVVSCSLRKGLMRCSTTCSRSPLF